jgi:hypothetical protein
MGYPVTLNGRTYTLADFEGQNYVSGFPDALEDFVTDAGANVTATQNAQTAAEAAQTAAEAAQAAAEAAQEAIDGLYLGAQASNPTVDLNGDPLTAGDWYFNTTDNTSRVYDGSAWNTIDPDLIGDASPQLGGTLDANGNDIDMGVNLITDAKVGQWDTAYGWGDHSAAGYLTSYTETDTLDSVTGRGATTTNAVTVGNLTSTGIDDNATSTAITIDSSQNVGVGVTPATDLHVSSSTTSSAFRLTNSGTTGAGFDVLTSGDNGYVYNRNNSSLIFGTNNTDRMTIDASGNVGIGDGAISATLDLHSTTAGRVLSVEGSGGKWASIVSGTGTTGPLLAFDNTASRFRICSGSDKLGTGLTEHFIVEPSGDVGIGVVPGAARVDIKGSTSDSTAYAQYTRNSGGSQLFSIRNDGLMSTGVQATSPYNLTTGLSANMHVNSAGNVFRSTSSARYKRNIQDMTYGVADVMNLRAVTFEQKNEYPSNTYAGFIAEEVHDAGLTEFVEYNDAGQPDAVHYGNMVSLLTKAIQEQQATIASLTARIEQLEAN